jgi:plasmid stabilization system protein ParE
MHKLKIRFLPGAETEMRQASDYLDVQEPELGYRFLLEVMKTAEIISKNPFIRPVILDNIRRIHVNHFSYRLCYVIEPEEVLILAVEHTSRDPFYWKDRLSE